MIEKRLSVYLDVLRFSAALVVLVSHFAYTRFSDGRYAFFRDWNLGSDAVVVFFVLSGLVIAFTSGAKDKTLGRFAFNRSTRLISVAVPAVLLTFALDRIGSTLEPVTYTGWWYNPLDLGRMLFSGLTFSSEWSGQTVRMGTNGPYWSLSYEVAYYVMFGLAVYVKGARRLVLLALSVLVFGVNVMILLPAWLLGVWLFHHLQKSPAATASNAPLMAIAPVVLYVAMLAIDLPAVLTNLTINLTSQSAVYALRFSDEFVWNWLIAVCFAVHLAGMSTWLRGKELHAVRTIRWLAGASFSLYLVHYPVLQFFSAVLPKSDVWFIDDMVLLGLTLAVCFAFAELFERRLKPFRIAVRRVTRMPVEAAKTPEPVAT